MRKKHGKTLSQCNKKEKNLSQLKKWQRRLRTGSLWLRTEASGGWFKGDMKLLIALNIRILLD